MLLYVDEMLGKLCRFLRIIGEKCIYLGEEKGLLINNPSLISQETYEEEVLISRNKKNIHKLIEYVKERYKAEVSKVVVLPYTSLSSQLLKLRDLNIIKKVKIHQINTPRCTICGRELEIISTSSSSPPFSLPCIPEKVLNYHTTFYFCSYCNKCYWKGKHWENITRVLNSLKS